MSLFVRSFVRLFVWLVGWLWGGGAVGRCGGGGGSGGVVMCLVCWFVGLLVDCLFCFLGDVPLCVR